MNGFNVAILVTTFCVLVAGLFAVIVERTEQRDEAVDNLARERREHKAETDLLAATVRTAAADIARLEAECDNHAATNAALVAEAALTDSATGTTVRVPLLRVVPKPRTEDDYWLNLYDEKGNHRG